MILSHRVSHYFIHCTLLHYTFFLNFMSYHKSLMQNLRTYCGKIMHELVHTIYLLKWEMVFHVKFPCNKFFFRIILSHIKHTNLFKQVKMEISFFWEIRKDTFLIWHKDKKFSYLYASQFSQNLIYSKFRFMQILVIQGA